VWRGHILPQGNTLSSLQSQNFKLLRSPEESIPRIGFSQPM
jgi:hypothetical protein